MKTLEEYNKEYHERQKQALRAGVACDECWAEMEYTNVNIILTSQPPMRAVKCPKCNHTGYKVG